MAAESQSDMSRADDALPSIVGIFVTAFHSKEGYKIIWQRSEVDLTDCEYKTLPSGIERVKEDVVYFTHRSCLGLAAYRNLQISGEPRQDITCISVGLLVMADSGHMRHQRLNKVWLFNSILHEFAAQYKIGANDYSKLDHFYDAHKAQNKKVTKSTHSRSQSPPASPVLSHKSTFKNYQSFRSERQATQSKTTMLLPARELSNLHPVLSLHDCISLFGPLIFPVFRAALARKRILLVTEAPVQRACHFIYNIQLLSAIPNNATTMRRPTPLRQLFCLGLKDIPFLQSLAATDGDEHGWIGVTTDQIYEHKPELWDVLIKLPAEVSEDSLASSRRRPTIICSDGTPIMTSYLDALNFNKLKPYLPLYRDTGLRARPEPSFKRSLLDSIVSGFWYWASAGQSFESDQEIHLEHDNESVDHLEASYTEEDTERQALVGRKTASTGDGSSISNGRDEVIVLVIFHRLTTNILAMLDELSCEFADEVKISRDQMVKIGLTPRLPADIKLAEDLGARWFGRDFIVDRSFWPCC